MLRTVYVILIFISNIIVDGSVISAAAISGPLLSVGRVRGGNGFGDHGSRETVDSIATPSSGYTSNTNATTALTAIVIGAGPSGLAVALCLSQVCDKVYLVEKHHKFEQRGATFGLAPNGQRVLNQIHHSLYEKLQEIAIPSSTSTTGDTTDAFSHWVFVWWEFRNALLDCVRNTSNIVLYCGLDFTEIFSQEDDANNGCIWVKFGDKSDNNDDGNVLKEIRGDFLVGADGVHSKVRREFLNHAVVPGTQAPPIPPCIVTNTTNFRGTIDVPMDASPKLRSFLDKGIVPLSLHYGTDMYFVVFNFHAKQPGRMAWILATQRDVDEDDQGDGSRPLPTVTPLTIARDKLQSSGDGNKDEVKLLEEIFALSQPDHMRPYPKTSIVDWTDETIHRLLLQRNDKPQEEKQEQTKQSDHDYSTIWGGRGRMTLVGDAAHGMRPTDGYGGSIALEDAVVLRNILIRERRVNNSNRIDVPQVLREFERRRYPRVKRVYDNQFDRYQQRMLHGKPVGPQDQDFLEWIYSGFDVLDGLEVE